jgi:hypothetical protein
MSPVLQMVAGKTPTAARTGVFARAATSPDGSWAPELFPDPRLVLRMSAGGP